jgi:TctA family transporter
VDPNSDTLPDMPSWARQQSEQFGTSSWGEAVSAVDVTSLQPVAPVTRILSATRVGTIHEYNEAFSVACYTSFITTVVPALILERIARELTNLSVRFTSDYEHAMVTRNYCFTCLCRYTRRCIAFLLTNLFITIISIVIIVSTNIYCSISSYTGIPHCHAHA